MGNDFSLSVCGTRVILSFKQLNAVRQRARKWGMDKKILAIAVVFCLDLVFIFYAGGMFYSVEPEDSVHLGSLSQTSYPKEFSGAGVPDSSRDTSAVVSNDRNELLRTRNVAAPLPPVSGRSRVSRTSRRSSPTDVGKQDAELFTDTIILIKRSKIHDENAQSRPAKHYPANKTTSDNGPKKRSVFSRALPVAKKPYDWMKSLVSKL